METGGVEILTVVIQILHGDSSVIDAMKTDLKVQEEEVGVMVVSNVAKTSNYIHLKIMTCLCTSNNFQLVNCSKWFNPPQATETFFNE